MQVFIAAVSLALIVSFLCSIFESVLLSINYAQIEALVQQGKRSGQLLKQFKHRIDMPIAAILITNTVAHTVGTAVAGATYHRNHSENTRSHAYGEVGHAGRLWYSRAGRRFAPAGSLEWGRLPMATGREGCAGDLH